MRALLSRDSEFLKKGKSETDKSENENAGCKI